MLPEKCGDGSLTGKSVWTFLAFVSAGNLAGKCNRGPYGHPLPSETGSGPIFFINRVIVSAQATDEVKTVRTLMVARDITRRQLATALGPKIRNLNGHLTRGVECVRTRAKLEKFFGCAIWCHPQEFARRRHCEKVLGFDPETLMDSELLPLAIRVRIPGPTGLCRRQLVERLHDFSSANPNHPKPV